MAFKIPLRTTVFQCYECVNKPKPHQLCNYFKVITLNLHRFAVSERRREHHKTGVPSQRVNDSLSRDIIPESSSSFRMRTTKAFRCGPPFRATQF